MNDEQIVCLFCERQVSFDPAVGLWVDPLATGDDSIWRETCEANTASFMAEHSGCVAGWGGIVNDDYVCVCGNQPHYDGFYPCDSDGVEIEPVADGDWDGLYVCGRCGVIG